MTDPVPDAVVAIDVGGTSMKGALLAGGDPSRHGAGGDPSRHGAGGVGPVGGRVLARLDAATPAAEGGAAVLAAVVALARRLAGSGPARVVGAAAITPGQVHDGVVRFAANLGWRDMPLATELSAALGVPATVEHDAAGAALAEASIDGRTDCLFVALGTGIGAGHVRAGRVSTGSTGGAGELGHIPVYPDGGACACGQRGCLEVYASAAGVVRRYVAAGGTAAVGGADDVVARLGTDPVAATVWAEAIEALALALATATLLVDPGVVVLGGGLARAGDALLVPLSGRLAARLAWRPPPPLELSVLGTDAGWQGAGLLAWTAAVAPPPAPAGTTQRLGVG